MLKNMLNKYKNMSVTAKEFKSGASSIWININKNMCYVSTKDPTISLE